RRKGEGGWSRAPLRTGAPWIYTLRRGLAGLTREIAGSVERRLGEMTERNARLLASAFAAQQPGPREAALARTAAKLQTGLARIGVCAVGQDRDTGSNQALRFVSTPVSTLARDALSP